MRFGIIVATRGRPQQAAAVLESARMLASGDHEVRCILACDEDDPGVAEFFKNYPGIEVDCRPRPPGVAECWNRNMREGDCDAYMNLPDDGVISTPNWDRIAAKCYEGEGDEVALFPTTDIGCFAWSDTANPGQPTILMMHRRWLDRAGYLDARFPFWFADTAMAETYSFVTGVTMPIVPQLIVAARPNRYNPRLRDMDFWWDFYIWTRRERMAKAAEIRDALGFKLNDAVITQAVQTWEQRDKAGREASLKIVEGRPPVIPSVTYLKAKANAESLMKEAA